MGGHPHHGQWSSGPNRHGFDGNDHRPEHDHYCCTSASGGTGVFGPTCTAGATIDDSVPDRTLVRGAATTIDDSVPDRALVRGAATTLTTRSKPRAPTRLRSGAGWCVSAR